MRRAIEMLMEAVGHLWPFDDHKHYPGLKAISERDIRGFGFRHMIFHLAKETGTLARIEERHEHRGAKSLTRRDWLRVRRLAMKVIVSGFRLFLLSGGTPEELEKYITKSKS